MEGKDTVSQPEAIGGRIEVREDGRKTPKLTQVSVVIREADNHYIVTFDHGSSKRVFHNMQELLTAIEVKVKEISHG